MQIPLFNTVVSWILKKRKYQVDMFLNHPVEVQNEVLYELLSEAKHTLYGKKYGFEDIKSYRSFAKTVPIRQYESIEPFIGRIRKGEQNVFWPSKIHWFAKSSGTTNAKSKFIPVSDEAIDDCHMKAGKDMLCLFINNNEDTEIFKGKGLRLGGSSAIYEDNDTYFGDLSAIIIENMPFWADFSSAPSQKTALMSEWETKMDAIIKETIPENITSLSGVPSWMLVLLNRVLEVTGKNNILEVWPNLEVYFHGGVNFKPYKEQYQKLIPKKDFRYYETYNASEGFFAIQDRNNSDELLLMLDYGIFYEFIPMDQYKGEDSIAIPLEQVEKDVNYAMVITTNSGLWRYLIGDTVKFTDTNPYRIKITGRTKHFINVFGEELVVENAEDALEVACRNYDAVVNEFTVAPIFMDGEKSGGHEWLIEFQKVPDDTEGFITCLDETLKSLNSDYEAKRYLDMTIKRPVVHCAPSGLFYQWLKNNGKLGGQHKVPRLSNSRNYLEELLSIA
ncbi:GH3 auxin-responsive promoter family protein [Lutimonas saemankumensis]|uniref:GH3 auxin-responsive promoter family protein n=1 Tax=Lutimonas saemankumensis TaxID=483016 RepID=UPI001CD4DCB5|nr:GH3 auxin-responsive promoter family protein [Lutimonas saemankumensis]MCA0933483.1 GH3 auxin-responsive promoter family protein [Lutimonas saemankumensis]